MNIYNYSRKTRWEARMHITLFAFLLMLQSAFNVNAQNWGFEATPVTSPPSNWTVVTGTWTINTNATYIRTGTQSMKITDPATSGTTIGTTTPFLTTSSAGYLITIGWGKSNTASNALFYTGYRTGTTNTFNPTTTTSGQPANINNTTWSRVVSVSTSGTIAAGNYGIPIRAFRSASTAGTEVYLDDFIIYGSSSNVPDLSAPTSASSVTITGNNISWNNGIDNGSPASGIGGVVIIRTDGVSIPAPTLNDQAMYSAVNGAAGVGTFVDGGNTWTVITSINGSGTTSFTDLSAGVGPYTYVVYMRDLAYNYSAGAAGTAATPCTDPPTAGTPGAIPSTPVCASTSVTLNLTGGTGGTGQTYQWESSLTSGGTFTPVSGVLTSSTFIVNPTVTTFYRCVVTCGSGSSTSSEVQVTVTPAFPGGTYTINSLLPTGGTNFNSFQAAINAITLCGISGPIVFNVTAGSGPYNEQVTIPQINGASSTNTITINGNGASLIYSSANTNLREAILLNGADHFTIDSLYIDVSGGTYGWGIRLTNSADSNIISNCQINTFANSTSTNYAGIIMSGSATAATTSGDNGDGNLFIGNTIINGYYGFTLVGNSAGPFAQSNRLVDNEIIDHYLYGVYAIYNENTEIKGNRIHHDSRSTATTMYGIYLTTSCSNVDISENRIYNFFIGIPTSTSTGYGIYVLADGIAGTENRLFNNIIYSFRGNSGYSVQIDPFISCVIDPHDFVCN